MRKILGFGLVLTIVIAANTLTLSVQAQTATNGIPTGLVMFFTTSSCPSGWSELTSARGRYVVGLPAGGSLSGTQGTALSNLENRAVGQHNHTIYDPGHLHNLTAPNSGTNGGVWQTGNNTAGPTLAGALTSSVTTGITINSSGSITGTNAPYIQLLVCQKNEEVVIPNCDGYIDSDGDSYGAGPLKTVQCPSNNLPQGYVSNNTDCNDSDKTKWQNLTGYVDGDRDNYGAGSSSSICSGSSLPTGYVTNNTDCYDSNANAKPGQASFFTSHRGDGSFDYNCNGNTALGTDRLSAHNGTTYNPAGRACGGSCSFNTCKSSRTIPDCGNTYYEDTAHGGCYCASDNNCDGDHAHIVQCR